MPYTPWHPELYPERTKKEEPEKGFFKKFNVIDVPFGQGYRERNKDFNRRTLEETIVKSIDEGIVKVHVNRTEIENMGWISSCSVPSIRTFYVRASSMLDCAPTLLYV